MSILGVWMIRGNSDWVLILLPMNPCKFPNLAQQW
jgi:hypothetical protein